MPGYSPITYPIALNKGGLGADVSAYNGLVSIVSGAAYEVVIGSGLDFDLGSKTLSALGGGGGSSLDPVVVAVCKSADQTGMGASDTTITFGTEHLDDETAFASNTFTAPHGPYVRIVLNTYMTCTASSTVQFHVFKNGVKQTNERRYAVIDPSTHAHASFEWIFACTTGDTFYLTARFDSGSGSLLAETSGGTVDGAATSATFQVLTGTAGNAVPLTRTLNATAPIRIDGANSADLSAARTFSIDYDTDDFEVVGTDLTLKNSGLVLVWMGL